MVCQNLPFRLSGSMTCTLNTNIATPMDHNSTCIVLLSLSATLHMHIMCVRYTLHCLQSIQSSLPEYYSVHSTTMVNENLWACIGGPFLHSSLIFNCCTVEFLTCTQHSENYADPLVQSLTIPNSEKKIEVAMWSNTRRFYGYRRTAHSVMLWPIHAQTPMLWSEKSIRQRIKLTQTSFIYIYVATLTSEQVMNSGLRHCKYAFYL